LLFDVTERIGLVDLIPFNPILRLVILGITEGVLLHHLPILADRVIRREQPEAMSQLP
jgi:hypothetical protein